MITDGVIGAIRRRLSDIERKLAALQPVPGAWSSYTPVLSQGGTVTATVNYSEYVQIGKTVFFAFDLSVTGSGTSGQAIFLTLPVSVAGTAAGRVGGTVQIYDASATSLMISGPETASAGAKIVFRSNGTNNSNTGITPAFGLASGDLLRGSVFYEVA